jgi:hypothetical protein
MEIDLDADVELSPTELSDVKWCRINHPEDAIRLNKCENTISKA